jgi:hypothetical protein
VRVSMNATAPILTGSAPATTAINNTVPHIGAGA